MVEKEQNQRKAILARSGPRDGGIAVIVHGVDLRPPWTAATPGGLCLRSPGRHDKRGLPEIVPRVDIGSGLHEEPDHV